MSKAAKHELSVLVVDDEENIRLVISRALEKEGYRISTAKSGEEALSVLHRCLDRGTWSFVVYT